MSDVMKAILTHPLLLVAAGGAIGSVCRYLLGRSIDGHTWHGGFPLGTFTINVLGSFLLGFIVITFIERLGPVRREVFLILGTGLCGGFTTFSTFEWETYRLLREEKWLLAIQYVLGSVFAGLLALFLGGWIAAQIFGHRN